MAPWIGFFVDPMYKMFISKGTARLRNFMKGESLHSLLVKFFFSGYVPAWRAGNISDYQINCCHAILANECC